MFTPRWLLRHPAAPPPRTAHCCLSDTSPYKYNAPLSAAQMFATTSMTTNPGCQNTPAAQQERHPHKVETPTRKCCSQARTHRNGKAGCKGTPQQHHTTPHAQAGASIHNVSPHPRQYTRTPTHHSVQALSCVGHQHLAQLGTRAPEARNLTFAHWCIATHAESNWLTTHHWYPKLHARAPEHRAANGIPRACTQTRPPGRAHFFLTDRPTAPVAEQSGNRRLILNKQTRPFCDVWRGRAPKRLQPSQLGCIMGS